MSTDEITVRAVTLQLCDPCLDGAGGECHTPGCMLWMNRAPDFPLRTDYGFIFRCCKHCAHNGGDPDVHYAPCEHGCNDEAAEAAAS